MKVALFLLQLASRIIWIPFGLLMLLSVSFWFRDPFFVFLGSLADNFVINRLIGGSFFHFIELIKAWHVMISLASNIPSFSYGLIFSLSLLGYFQLSKIQKRLKKSETKTKLMREANG